MHSWCPGIPSCGPTGSKWQPNEVKLLGRQTKKETQVALKQAKSDQRFAQFAMRTSLDPTNVKCALSIPNNLAFGPTRRQYGLKDSQNMSPFEAIKTQNMT
jgi:hypothetical protein